MDRARIDDELYIQRDKMPEALELAGRVGAGSIRWWCLFQAKCPVHGMLRDNVSQDELPAA
jgi:hypothetical protein